MKTTWILNSLAILSIFGIIPWFIIRPTTTNNTSEPQKKVWVYIEIKKVLPRDTSDYFFYGKMNESLINRINDDKDVKGLFMLSDIRYWNDDDLLQIYEDDEDTGYKIFRLEDIQYINAYADIFFKE